MTQRQEIIERLRAVDLGGGSHEMLSAICKAVLPHGDAWTLRRCADLRDRLVRLLGEAEQPNERDGRITDELRKWSDRYTMRKDIYDELTDIADRIDAAHERECKEQYACGEEHGIGASIEASMIQDHGYIELPKDADGEYIHVGDVMDSDHYEDGTVVGLQFFNTENKTPRVLIAIRPHGWDTPTWRDPESYRHYHAPTVEDVLYDSLKHFGAVEERTPEVDSWVCEQAAKLRKILAGDAE